MATARDALKRHIVCAVIPKILPKGEEAAHLKLKELFGGLMMTPKQQIQYSQEHA